MDKIAEIPFRQETEALFRKMPVMDMPLFLRSVELITGCTDSLLSNLIRRYIRNGIVLLSENGYVTTKFSLPVVTEGEPEVRLNGNMRVNALNLKPFFRNCLDCYPLILDMYPVSRHFRISDSLFPLSFVHEAKGLLYELIRIPKNQEELYRGILLKDAFSCRDEEFNDYRSSVRRIAVVESEACAERVPYVGFFYICVKEKSEKGFRIVEKRTGETWKDLFNGKQ